MSQPTTNPGDAIPNGDHLASKTTAGRGLEKRKRQLTAATKTLLLHGAFLLVTTCLHAAGDSTADASTRQPWTTSRLKGSPTPPPAYVTEPAFRKLKFENPVELKPIPTSSRLCLMEVSGRLYSFTNQAEVPRAELFADLSKLVPEFNSSFGLAFHPGFATNREVFVCYTLKGPPANASHVSRFKVSQTEPPMIEAGSEQLVFTWPAGGHNAGSIQFGPEGFLYVATGDSADPSPPDPLNTGQDLSDYLSSILRIDVDHTDPGRRYRIPADNPFVSLAGAKGEIWAYGLRNPWRMSFDVVTGDLWVGDVGWDLWEMVHRIQRGGNYGWSIMEGPQPVKPENPRGPTPILPPVAVHPHTEARSISGGYVYRGKRLPELEGAYIYGDYMTGRIWGLRQDGKSTTWKQELALTPLRIVAFGVDAENELFILDYGSGTVNRLNRNPASGSNSAFPRRLSETGLFSSVKDQIPAAGVYPYSIRAELWSDGAAAQRWMALPGQSRISLVQTSDWETGEEEGGWHFPTNAVLAKTLSLELIQGNPASRRRLETQILHFDGRNWQPYVYRWNEDQTDAILSGAEPEEKAFVVQDAKSKSGQRRQTWHFSSRSECVFCHGASAGGQFAFNAMQLDRSPGPDQLTQFSQLGLFEKPVARTNITAASELEGKVRAYLDVNCSHCHRPNAGGAATINARWIMPREKLGLLDARPTQGDFGLANARLVSPGHPEQSVLLFRMSKMGNGHMPHVGSGMIDTQAVRMIRDWIRSLGNESQPGSSPLSRLRADQLSDRDLSSIITSLLQNPSSALDTAMTLDDPAFGIPEQLQSVVLQAARQDASPMIRDLFERFIPEEQRIARLGSVIEPARILALKGHPEAGRRVFFETAQCGTCHVINGQGRPVGPNLAEKTSRMSRLEILDNVLHPSNKIDPEFVVQLVRLKDGETTNGFLRGRNDREIILLDATGQEVRLKSAEVESLTPQKLSLMPEGLLQNLTAQEAADLVEFLVDLGKP